MSRIEVYKFEHDEPEPEPGSDVEKKLEEPVGFDKPFTIMDLAETETGKKIIPNWDELFFIEPTKEQKQKLNKILSSGCYIIPGAILETFKRYDKQLEKVESEKKEAEELANVKKELKDNYKVSNEFKEIIKKKIVLSIAIPIILFFISYGIAFMIDVRNILDFSETWYIWSIAVFWFIFFEYFVFRKIKNIRKLFSMIGFPVPIIFTLNIASIGNYDFLKTGGWIVYIIVIVIIAIFEQKQINKGFEKDFFKNKFYKKLLFILVILFIFICFIFPFCFSSGNLSYIVPEIKPAGG